MIVLLVEDVQQKLDNIVKFLRVLDTNIVLMTAKSVQAALHLIEAHPPDLILLDMSLPVFDYSLKELGFKHISYAGKDIIDFLDSNDLLIPVIVITAFDRFGTEKGAKTLQQLDKELSQNYPDQYLGSVYYNSLEDNWQEKLKTMITIFKNKE